MTCEPRYLWHGHGNIKWLAAGQVITYIFRFHPTGRPEDAPIQAVTPQIPAKNYFKSVSENKEIAKLVSLLSTCVNSTKKEVTTALEKFAHYHPIWQKERNETLEEFLAAGPKLSDFQAMLVHYRDLEAEITAEPEFYNVGAIALFTGKLFQPLISCLNVQNENK